MTFRSIGRRRVVGVSLALAALGPSVARASSALDALAAGARTEGPISWYQTSPVDQVAPYVRAFETRFPGVRVSPLRMVGGSDMGGRIVQELQAGAATADVGTGGRESVHELAKRGLLLEADWGALGVPAALIIAGTTIVTASAIYLMLFNQRLVAAADAPRDWEDLLHPRWAGGRMALWASAAAFANLAKQWGEARATSYVERIAAQEPQLHRSMYNLAQAVAAGEAQVGVATNITALPAFQAGAPLGYSLGDPISMSPLTSFGIARSRRPNATQLFLAWMGSAEGAQAFEDAIGVGVHVGHPTRTARMTQGRAVSEFGPDEQEVLVALRHRFNLILRSGGRDAG